jgi:DNA end-binding protein Ku
VEALPKGGIAMAARPSWDGFIKFNLISVPVKAYSATVSGSGKIGFHLIHKDCNSRIRYKKVCPIHGEVSNDEIVSAYEYAKGQYIVVDAEERKKLRIENDKAIAIDVFIRPEVLDPLYFTERTYYLVPDGKVAHKPYAVLRDAMAEDNRYAVAQVVFSGQGHVAVVRPIEQVLAMTLLSYEDQIKKPTAFEDEVQADASAEERKLATTLIEAATTKDFDLGRYRDEYTERLTKLLEARGKGKKIVTAAQDEEPAVINLMDALRKSLDQTQQEATAKKRGKKSSPRRRTG